MIAATDRTVILLWYSFIQTILAPLQKLTWWMSTNTLLVSTDTPPQTQTSGISVLPFASSFANHSSWCSAFAVLLFVHMGTSDLTHSAITAIPFSRNPLKMTCHYVYFFVSGEGIHNVGSEEGAKERLAFPLPASPPHKGHAAAQWLRHCATNRKVADLIPDGVTGIFHRHNPSGRTMAMGGKCGLCVGLKPYHLRVPIVMKSGTPKLLEPSGPLQGCTGIDLPLRPPLPRNNAL